MTIIYVPRLIESAEQAEALPDGTVAISKEFAPEVFVKNEDSWMGTHGPGAFTNESAVGLEALVPIEAEEETSVVVRAAGLQDIATHPYSEASMDSDGNVWFGDGLSRVDVTDEFNEWAKQHTRTRYVTPWEDA